MGSRAIGGLAAASAVVVALVAMQGVAVAAHQWSIEAAAVPAGSNPSTLLKGVSCPSRSSCVAVGGFSTDSARGPLVERWDGASWAIESAPNPEGGSDGTLLAVSCPSPTACEAVGYAFFPDGFRPFAERWDGSAWTAQSVPFPGGDEGDLEGVSCAGATDCVAVGRDDTSAGSNAFLVRWDGSTWTTQTAVAPPQAAELHGVSCSATAACTAVGDAGATREGGADLTLALRWDGTSWTTQPSPTLVGVGEAELLGASCRSSTACTAVGFLNDDINGTGVPLVQTWDGRTWSTEPTPGLPGEGRLSGVSCPSSDACVTVGDQGLAIAETWDGTSWKLQSIPAPAGATRSALNGVSCTAARRCVAVGWYYDGFTSQPLIERLS